MINIGGEGEVHRRATGPITLLPNVFTSLPSSWFTFIFNRTKERGEIYGVPRWYLNNAEFGLNYCVPQVRQDSILKNSPPRCLKRGLLLGAEVDDNRLVTSIVPHRGKVAKNCLTQAFY